MSKLREDLGRACEEWRQTHMPKLRRARDSDLAQFNRWVHGLLQWGSLDAPQAFGVFSSQEEKAVIGTDLWDAWAGSGDDYEILDFGDGTFTFKKKERATPPPPPTDAKEVPPICIEWKHEIEKYVGFTEAYDFCKVCDAKKIDGKWVRN